MTKTMLFPSLSVAVIVWACCATADVLETDHCEADLVRQDYSVKDRPTALAIGDFNRDGALDIATAHAAETISVLLGNGDGTFLAHQSYGTPYHSGFMVAEDFNGDGDLDLAVDRAVLLGDGKGGFNEHRPVEEGGVSAAAADFNNDGNVDLALDQTYPRRLLILLGNRDGTFREPLSTTIPHAMGGISVCRDFNEDGFVDVAVTYGTGEDEYGPVYKATEAKSVEFYSHAGLLLGNGDGTLGEVRELLRLYDSESCQLATGDLDQDSHLDLVVAREVYSLEPPGQLRLLLGNGKGDFNLAPELAGGSEDRFWSQTPFIADVDQDGVLDIGVLRESEMSFALGTGDGTFGEFQGVGSAGTGASNIAAADLNADGRVDLAVTNTGGHVSVFLNQGPSAVEMNGGVELSGRVDGLGNWPNPFNACTVISYVLPEHASARLTVYDVSGQEVVALVDGTTEAGTHAVAWDGRDACGRVLASGAYFVRLETPKSALTKRMILLK